MAERSWALREKVESLWMVSLNPIIMTDYHVLCHLRVQALPKIKFYYYIYILFLFLQVFIFLFQTQSDEVFFFLLFPFLILVPNK